LNVPRNGWRNRDQHPLRPPVLPDRSRLRTQWIGVRNRLPGAIGNLLVRASAKLAVLAAAAVDAATTFFTIGCGLAGHTQTHAGNGLAPRLRDRLVALFAVGQPRPLAQPAARARDRVLDGRVDLVLYGSVSRPTRCHGASGIRSGEKHTPLRVNSGAAQGRADQPETITTNPPSWEVIATARCEGSA